MCPAWKGDPSPMDLSPASELAAAAADLHSELDVESTVQTVLHHARALTGGDSVAVMIGRRS